MCTDFPELKRRYLEWLQYNKGRSADTIRKYGGYLDRLSNYINDNDLSLFDISLNHLEKFTGTEAHNAGLATNSRRPMIAAISGFFDWLEREGVVSDNPSEFLPYPKKVHRLPVPINLKNAEKIIMQCDLNTFKGVRDAAMLSILYGCGVRVSGLCSLNQSSLNFVMHKGVEWLIIKPVEKGKQERQIPVPHEARLYVRAYLGHHELEAINRSLPNADQVLFVSLRNRSIPECDYYGEARRISPRSVNDMIELYGNKAGVPRDQAHPHAARHLYATELTEDDVNQTRIQRLLGHADANSTQVYVHLAMRKLMDEVDRANPLGKMNVHMSGLVKNTT